MGRTVPADDLPANIVPASDLPDSPAPQKANAVTVTPPNMGTIGAYPEIVGLAEPALAVATGLAGSAAGGLAGLAGAALPGEAGQGAKVAERVSSALTYEPQTRLGRGVMKAISLPGELYNRFVADPIGERGAQASPAVGAFGKASAEVLPLLLGARSALKDRPALTKEQQKVAKARDQGFTMTPEEMKAGLVPRTAASLAGEPRLAKVTSAKNAALAVEKAKAELGLPPEATLDLDTLAKIRKKAGNSYASVRRLGPIEMDAKYLADLDALAAKYRSAAKDFPGLANADVEKVITALKKEDPAVAQLKASGAKIPEGSLPKQTFDANSAVDMISQLRESADKAYRAGDNGLGKVMRGSADALEAQIERHLAGNFSLKDGIPGGQLNRQKMLTDFRAARERIAKTYAVQKALVGDDALNPQAFAKQLEKGKPLTGNLREIGDFARNFQRSSQKPTQAGTGATMHDLILAGVNAARTGGGSLVKDALTVGARPLTRYGLSSRIGQTMMDPRTNLSFPAGQALGISPALPQPQEESR